MVPDRGEDGCTDPTWVVQSAIVGALAYSEFGGENPRMELPWLGVDEWSGLKKDLEVPGR